MGTALAAGWVAAGMAANDIHIVETGALQRRALKKSGYSVHASLPALAPALTVLAIKPQGFAAFAPALGKWYIATRTHPVLSILAGTTLAQLQKALGSKAPVIRAMPNTPALVGEGVSGVVASASAKPAHKALAVKLLGVVGDVIQLSHEADIDAITALSGSGPAYVFHFLEAMIAASVKLGLPEDVATPLALQTLRGALVLAESSEESLATLRQNVTSKGGTTEAALVHLMDKKLGLSPLLLRAMKAAHARSKSLSRM